MKKTSKKTIKVNQKSDSTEIEIKESEEFEEVVDDLNEGALSVKIEKFSNQINQMNSPKYKLCWNIVVPLLISLFVAYIGTFLFSYSLYSRNFF